jgi:ABC-type bacteriocin/lantibiotic exporter with double-glycine peptidase domain
MTSPFYPIRLPVPHAQQSEQGECLAICTAMVLTYRHIRFNYRRLLKVLRIQPGVGTAFPNIQALKQEGITVLYQQGSISDLYTFLSKDRPVIVPVKTSELPYWEEQTDHAVVVVGMDSHSIYLNDPAFSTVPMQVSHGDFDLAWLERDEYYAVLAP